MPNKRIEQAHVSYTHPAALVRCSSATRWTDNGSVRPRVGMGSELAGDFFGAAFGAAFSVLGQRLSREQTAHQIASSRPWAWDCDIVSGILATYDPLPTTARADAAYVEVAALLCDSLAPEEWGDARVLESVLSRELSRRARGEDASAASMRRVAKRFAAEYRRHGAHMANEGAA